MKHWAVFADNTSDKRDFLKKLLAAEAGLPKDLESLRGLRGLLFSKTVLDRYIDEEVRHDRKIITGDTEQSLITYSSGERKKALLQYQLRQRPDFLILENPFDNLDRTSKKKLVDILKTKASTLSTVSIISRNTDLLPFVNQFGILEGDKYISMTQPPETTTKASLPLIEGRIPDAPEIIPYTGKYLVQMKGINVIYGVKKVLHDIHWNIQPGDFWQLAGPNGSGKTTLLTLVTADNPKAYGQELYLFGRRRGSGESIWEIKKKIGYFTPAMVDRFRGYHSLENMLISGLHDSVGLYVQPTETERRLARSWLQLVGLEAQCKKYFHDLSLGHQRLLMCIRAMIKHPELLILDEPTAGLDDHSAALVVALVNKMAGESKTAIVFVSHREEPGLQADSILELQPSPKGSIAISR